MQLRSTITLQLNLILTDPMLKTTEQLEREYPLFIQNVKDYCFSDCPEVDSRLEVFEAKGVLVWKQDANLVFKFPFGNLVL